VADFCYYISPDDAWEIGTTDVATEEDEEEIPSTPVVLS